ncbi:MAG: 2'-5' RNA ligase family protein [Burkholderiaceae bacterium]
MAEQLFFDGIDAPAPPTDRLFFALLPDEYAATQADRFRQRLAAERGLAGKQVRTEHLHVTLHHLGDHAGVPAGLVEQAGVVAGGLVASPFEAEFQAVMSFSRGARQQPLVLCGGHGLAALVAFQRALGVAMIKGGLGRWVDRDFTPHMTLAYDPQTIERHDIRPISWVASELVMVHSLLGQTRHVIAGRWPLRGPAAGRAGEGGAGR